MGDFWQGNLFVSLFLKMNEEYKENIVKHYMACYFNKFVRYFLQNVRSYTLWNLNKFDFSLGPQKNFQFADESIGE